MSRISRVFTDIRYALSELSFWNREKKARRKLRETWGRESSIDRDFTLIDAYYELSSEKDSPGAVDSKTWIDLNMDEVFCRLDRTVSSNGRQHLYKTLRCCAADQAGVDGQNRLYGIFRTNAALRQQIQLILSNLKSQNASYIIHLILGDIPAKPRLTPLIFFSSIATVASAALMIFTREYFYVPLLLAVVNIIIHAIYSNRLSQYVPGMSYLNAMLGVALSLTKIEDRQDLPQLTALSLRMDTIKTIRRAVGWMVA